MHSILLSPRSLIAGSLFILSIGLAGTLHAGPGPQYWTALRNRAQFETLKPGDKIDYVCYECKTVSEITIESHDQAMALCKEGATVTCPSCKKKATVVLKHQGNEPSSRKEIVYVNDKGKECAFIAKVSEQK